jgi:probable rRNA maturation factor
MELDIANETGEALSQECEDAIRAAASAAFELEAEGRQAEASLVLATPGRIRELNKRHRKIDKETDVLSFPQYESKDLWPDGPVLLGDIVISLERAKSQALEYGHPLARELAFLTAHSCLHLFGYDHADPEGERDMLARQEAALRRAGHPR